MPTRERVKYKGEIVTIIDPMGMKSSHRNIEVRDQYGFTHTVPKKELERLDKSDDRSTLTYGEDT